MYVQHGYRGGIIPMTYQGSEETWASLDQESSSSRFCTQIALNNLRYSGMMADFCKPVRKHGKGNEYLSGE